MSKKLFSPISPDPVHIRQKWWYPMGHRSNELGKPKFEGVTCRHCLYRISLKKHIWQWCVHRHESSWYVSMFVGSTFYKIFRSFSFFSSFFPSTGVAWNVDQNFVQKGCTKLSLSAVVQVVLTIIFTNKRPLKELTLIAIFFDWVCFLSRVTGTESRPVLSWRFCTSRAQQTEKWILCKQKPFRFCKVPLRLFSWNKCYIWSHTKITVTSLALTWNRAKVGRLHTKYLPFSIPKTTRKPFATYVSLWLFSVESPVAVTMQLAIEQLCQP